METPVSKTLVATLLRPQYQYLTRPNGVYIEGVTKLTVSAKSKSEWNQKCSHDSTLRDRLVSVVKQNCFAVRVEELNNVGALEYVTVGGKYVHEDGNYIIKVYEFETDSIKPVFIEGVTKNFVLSFTKSVNRNGKESMVFKIVDSEANLAFKNMPEMAQKQVADNLAKQFEQQFGLPKIVHNVVDIKSLGKPEDKPEKSAADTVYEVISSNNRHYKKTKLQLMEVKEPSKWQILVGESQQNLEEWLNMPF